MKKCPRCKTNKVLSAFPTDNSRKDKLYPHCRDCVSVKTRTTYLRNRKKYLAKDKEYRRNNPDKVKEFDRRKRLKNPLASKANCALNYAVKSGKIIRKPCEVCGFKKSQGHHDDYSKPLKVRWLCSFHHRKHHGRIIIGAKRVS